MRYIKSFLMTASLLLPIVLQAQTDSSTYNESVIIRGKFNPVLTRSEKINVPPAITDTSSTMDYHFGYQPEPSRLASFFAPSRFKPVRVVGEPRTRLYHNYIRIGFGNYWSPLLDVYYNSTTSRNLNYGVRLNHHSSWGTIGDEKKPEEYFGPAYNSLTDFNVFGKYIIKEKMQIYGDLTYQNDYNLYYGFCDTTLRNYGKTQGNNKTRSDIKTSDYKAPYNYIAGNAGIRNVSSASPWGYEANLHIADLYGGYEMNEFNIRLDGMASYRFQLSRAQDLLAALRLGLDSYMQSASDSLFALGHASETDPTWTPDSTYTEFASRLMMHLNPYAEITLADIRIHAGLRVNFDRYAVDSASQVYLYPDVTLSRNFLNDALGIAIGATGNADPISLNNIRILNPYTISYSQVNSYRHYDFFTNIRYNISKKLELDAHASYSMYENRLSFCLSEDYLLGNVFKPKYESGNVLTAGGDFSFTNDEMISLGVGGNYYYRMAAETDTLPILYAYPFDVHFNANINYNDRFFFHLQFLLMGKTDAAYEYDATEQSFVITEQLPIRYGLNFEFEYRHNKALSAFLKIDNLLFQRYYYWKNYPSQRALFTLGITYTIPTK